MRRIRASTAGVCTINPEPRSALVSTGNVSVHPEWRLAFCSTLLGAAAVLAFYSAGFSSLVGVLSSTAAYSFLLLVPVLSLYFLWLRLPEIRHLRPTPSALGVLYALPFSGLWLFAQATQLSIGLQIAAVGMLQGVILTVLGWQVCRRLLFPLLLLWMLVPVGDLLVPALMELTTSLTINGLHLVGMDAVADGNMLVAGGARYTIIQACSGLDFLLGNLLVSLVFANLIYRSTARKAWYVLASLPVAILANILRTISVILLTAGGVDLAADHAVYGWLLFFLAMVGQMAVGLRFQEVRNTRAAEELLPAPSPVILVPLVVATFGIVLLAALAPAYARYVLEPDTGPSPVALCLPASIGRAAALPTDAGAWRPVFPTASARVQGVLSSGAGPVEVFVAYYWRQGPSGKLIAWNNRAYDGTQWRYMTSGTTSVNIAGVPLRVLRTRLAGPDGQRRLVWQWYWVDGQYTGQAWVAKLLQARGVLFRRELRAAAILLSAAEFDVAEESGDAVPAALQAALDQEPSIAAMLKVAARADNPGRSCS